MDVSAAASAATAYKAAQGSAEVGTKVAEKALDLMKNQAELVIQLILKSMGVGQNLNTVA